MRRVNPSKAPDNGRIVSDNTGLSDHFMRDRVAGRSQAFAASM